MAGLLLSPDDIDPTRASRDVSEGRARRVARGIVTYDLDTPLDALVRANVWGLIARLIPGAVLTDRTAAAGATILEDEDGTARVFVAHPSRRRDLALPGLIVAVRNGPGPLPGDLRFMHDGLYVASQARTLVDNARLSRSRGGRVARTLTKTELEDKIAQLAATLGPQRLKRLRNDVEHVADQLEEVELGDEVSRMIGVAQGTLREHPTSSPALAARRDGVPFDERRVELFDVLAHHLEDRAPNPLVASPQGESRRATLPFFEAYFSNFIEGTEFDVDEAADIVYGGVIPTARPADAHDVLGTYRAITGDDAAHTPRSAEEVLELLRHRHAQILAARPEANPGQFKVTRNRVGSRVFVEPQAVVGTLRAGYQRIQRLDDPFARAVMMMFVVSEVHPFDDGNGRVARAMMNAELTAAGQHRIVIPTVYRNNYLAGLRAMTVNARPDAMIATLDFAQRWTARIDWSTIETAKAQLAATNALLDPSEAEDEGLRLKMPDGDR